MKHFSQYINEFLVSNHTKKQEKYNYAPQTIGELRSIVKERVKKEGRTCDLNDIDVSNIKDMSHLFTYIDFDGDISQWDTSNVIDMAFMFAHTNFQGDISKWDTHNVKDMQGMFYENHMFNCDISKWNFSKVINMNSMFYNAKSFYRDLSKVILDATKVNYGSAFIGSPLNRKKSFQPKFNI